MRGKSAALACALGTILALSWSGARGAETGRWAFSPSWNDYGTTGLLQMPSGRMADDGAFAIGTSRSDPYTRFFLTSQFLPWFQATFRYTDIGYAPYGIVDTQSYKDKAIDLKFRLVKEDADWPEISVGLRDVGGTGIFSSEYIAVSRRYYDFDFTAGMAWGNMGSRGHLPNPLGLFIDKAKVRPKSSGPGSFSLNFFRGENIALFGGVEWDTPVDGLRLKVEYDSNSYQSELFDEALEVKSPINVGVGYAPFDWLDLSLGYERGNTVMFRGVFNANFNDMTSIALLGEKPPLPLDSAVPSTHRETLAPDAVREIEASMINASVDHLFDTTAQEGLGLQSLDLQATAATITLDDASSAHVTADALARVGLVIAQMPTLSSLETITFQAPSGKILSRLSTSRLHQQNSTYGQALSQTPSAAESQEDIAARLFKALEYYNFQGQRFAISGNRATVVYSQSAYRTVATAFGRVARAVVLATPPSITEIDVIETSLGLPVARALFRRDDLIETAMRRESIDELWLNTSVLPAELPDDIEWATPPGLYPKFSWGASPHIRQSIGGPDNFYFYQIYGSGTAQLELAPGLRVKGSASVNLINNFDNFEYDAPSTLPRVRTNIRQYLTDRTVWIDNLHVEYMTSPGQDWYAQAAGGLFEMMYGGVGGEVLYRPTGKRWALGLDVNHVWQRDFDGGVGFNDYNVTTGHLTWYQTLPFYGLETTASVGRYLAKDVGATLSLSRRFDSGIKMGAWATKTNVSAEDFGEGAFDKGFFIEIPFDLFSPTPTASRGTIAFQPLTRDGGAKVYLPTSLYPVTGHGGTLESGWRDVMR